MRRVAVVIALSALIFAGAPVASAQVGVVLCVGSIAPLPVTCAGIYPTIQSAVDDASPGGAVLIGPGVYREAVVVSTPDITIRGVDRNTVELDGTGLANNDNGIEVADVPGVEVSNLTVHGFSHNGVLWNGFDADDYHARYVTAFNMGLYGVFTFEGAGGVFEDSYGSGNADSAFYIGGCHPCDAVIQRVVAENNGLGYSGTNAGGSLVIRDSVWRRNRAGIVPNTLDSEPNEPQREATIVNNLVEDSGNLTAPTTGTIAAATGFGIAIVGGNHNFIENNTIRNSSRYGIVVLPYPTETPNLYRPTGNMVRNNTISNSGLFDLALAGGSAERNCFSGNNPVSSDPPAIEELYACGATNLLLNSPVSGGALSTAELVSGLARYEALDCTPATCPDPRPQPTMPDPTVGLP